MQYSLDGVRGEARVFQLQYSCLVHSTGPYVIETQRSQPLLPTFKRCMGAQQPRQREPLPPAAPA